MKRSMALGRMNFRPGKRSMALGRFNFRPGKRSMALGRSNFRPGKRGITGVEDASIEVESPGSCDDDDQEAVVTHINELLQQLEVVVSHQCDVK